MSVVLSKSLFAFDWARLCLFNENCAHFAKISIVLPNMARTWNLSTTSYAWKQTFFVPLGTFFVRFETFFANDLTPRRRRTNRTATNLLLGPLSRARGQKPCSLDITVIEVKTKSFYLFL